MFPSAFPTRTYHHHLIFLQESEYMRGQSLSAPSSPIQRQDDDDSRGTVVARAIYHSPQPVARKQSQQQQRHAKKLVYDSPRIHESYVDYHSHATKRHNNNPNTSTSTRLGQLPPPPHLLQDPDVRWRYMSDLAGRHQQDAGTFCIPPQRVATPRALTAGMTKHAAGRVTTLHLPLFHGEEEEITADPRTLPNQGPTNSKDDDHNNMDDEDSLARLPAWLDAIATTFPNIRHLHLTKQKPQQTQQKNANNTPPNLLQQRRASNESRDPRGVVSRTRSSTCEVDDGDETDKYAVAAANDYSYSASGPQREPSQVGASSAPKKSAVSEAAAKRVEINAVRRLYVLYRLQQLESLDGIPFSAQEHELASFRRRNQQRSSSVRGTGNDPDEGWSEQARAKVNANSVPKSERVNCLVDTLEDEENDDPAVLVDVRQQFGATSEDSNVEVDSDGKPYSFSSVGQKTAPTISRSWRSQHQQQQQQQRCLDTVGDRVIRSPPNLKHHNCHHHSNYNRVDDDDHWEYVSVESSNAACEWAAACGAISLPYFRRSKLRSANSRDQAKSKFQLNYKRRDDDVRKNDAAFPTIPGRQSLRIKSIDNVETDSNGGQSLLDPLEQFETEFESTIKSSPERVTSKVPSNQSPIMFWLDENSNQPMPPNKPESPCSTSSSRSFEVSLNQRVAASQSLSSPFPLQFRVRAKMSASEHASPTRKPDNVNMGLKVMTDFSDNAEQLDYQRPPPSPQNQRDTTTMETIEIPISLSRTQSSPSKLPSMGKKLAPPPIVTRGALPPQCPGRRRNDLHPGSTIPRCNSTTKASMRKDRTKWRQTMTARSTSIVDDYDDDHDSITSSDEESIVINKAI